MSRPSTSHALFPGTFDPPTLGHVDLVRRALAQFGRVTVALARHPDKNALCTLDERLELWRRIAAGLPGTAVVPLAGLVVDGCRELGCNVIVRGVRSGTDFDYEVQMAQMNRAMHAGIDTVLLPPDPAFAHISSTLVRQIAALRGDVRPFVPREVQEFLAARFAAGAAPRGAS
ncbi:MAG: pantetheine-phosphate adenylyltransferase [Planctomycetota bacterium]|nr:MAG: pantetheine-phosphate adenylyltransferase [Planctomycetota bacterium]